MNKWYSIWGSLVFLTLCSRFCLSAYSCPPGKLYCGECHVGDQARIPSRVILHLDTDAYAVCRIAKQFLATVGQAPSIRIDMVRGASRRSWIVERFPAVVSVSIVMIFDSSPLSFPLPDSRVIPRRERAPAAAARLSAAAAPLSAVRAHVCAQGQADGADWHARLSD